MSILKYKYKAHKFINYAFYIVVFIFGFLLGFSTEKIDINKLISQVLMIDNVSAYTIYENENVTIDENFIYNGFLENFDNYNIEEYPYFVCTYSSDYNSTTPRTFHCMNFNQFSLDNISLESSTDNYYHFSIPSPVNYINWTYDTTLEKFTIQTTSVYDDNPASFSSYLKEGKYHYKSFTNFDLPFATDEHNNVFNQLLLGYSNLKFNENLFKDNPDFKEVCVNSSTSFAITSNNITYNDDTGLKYFNGIDFIWFSYVPEGLSTYLYTEETEDKVLILTEEGPLFSGINPGNWYYLDKKSEIDKFFNTNPSNGEIYPGITLEYEGYINQYSYFGWYFHPFVVHFDNTSDGGNYFSVFHFKDNINFYSIFENGLDYYEELENARNDNICFYIKKEYDITILEKDVFSDDIGETTILGGDKLNIHTSYNYSNLDSKGLFSKINLFINKIKDTIVFINNYIYELYTSMPYIVQLFIISIFGLIVVKILIGMVTR